MTQIATVTRRLLVALGLTMSAAGGSAARAQLSPRDSSVLVSITRQIVDAITPGDSLPWARVLAPDWFMIDEEGHRMSRADFLRSMHPLPHGQHGSLSIANWYATGDANVAAVTYDIDEVHDYYGTRLRTRFHATDTYVHRSGRWWQLASQVTALPTPVAGVAVPASRAREYAGTYELTSGVRITVAADDSGLTVASSGGQPRQLYALEARIFVRHGVRGFWVFEHDSTGAVSEVVNWRDNNAIVWRRLR